MSDKEKDEEKFANYAVNYSRAAQAQRDRLPGKIREIYDDIVEELLDEPTRYPARLTPQEAGAFVRYKHPYPEIEITFHADAGRQVLFIRNIAAPSFSLAHNLFVCYDQTDILLLGQLKKFLKPLEQAGFVTVWDDQSIVAGENRIDQIDRAVLAAHAAVLLVSIDFLNSKDVQRVLPKLLDAAQQGKVKILWIQVRPPKPTEEITRFQALHDDPPLDCFTKPKLARQLEIIVEKLKTALV